MMGYYSEFYGGITLSDEKYGKLIKLFISKGTPPFDHEFTDEEIEINDNEVTINIYEIKDYDNLMLKICYAICLIDNKASGEIDCYGESRDDMWRISIIDGKVFYEQGQIVYKQDENPSEFPEVTKDISEILKNKENLKVLLALQEL